MDNVLAECPSVLERLYKLNDCSVRLLPGGLINKTFLIIRADNTKYVLQKLSSQFGISVTNKVSIVSEHLINKGLYAPQLVLTDTGDLIGSTSSGNWRLFKYLEGFTKKVVTTVEDSSELARVLGSFHLSIQDCAGIPVGQPKKRGADFQLERLAALLKRFPYHASKGEVELCANMVRKKLKSLPALQSNKQYILHGDPKVSNFLFSNETPSVKCMIDLDTVGWSQLSWELADGFRSWCNSCSEDQSVGVFDVGIFEASLHSYLNTVKDFFPKEEILCSLDVTAHIFLELSVRFLVDAIEEQYFGWDSNAFESASSHNLVRAKGQLTACESLMDNWSEANQVFLNI